MIPVVFYSLTGQTRRFVNKLEPEIVIELKKGQETVILDKKSILIVPTYEDGLEFLDDFVDKNYNYIIGVIGSGNRNFGPLFCHVARKYSQKYGFPVLYEFEFNGTEEDVNNVKRLIINGT